MPRNVKRIGLLIFLFFSLNYQAVEAADYESIGPGVEYKKDDLIYGGYPQSTRVMKIQPHEHTRFQLGYTGPKALHRISAFGNSAEFSDQLIGGINGSFFNLSLAHQNMVHPNYLIVQDNEILHLGSMSSSDSGFMHTPAAFGIDKAGNPLIDTFDLEITAETTSGSVEIDRINTARGNGEIILYAPGQRRTATPTNEYGREFTVKNTNALINHDLSFGDTITGEISNLKNYGTRNASPIPGDGFIISGHGTTLDELLDSSGNGDQVSLTIDVEDKWKDAQMIIASGPLLVQRGEVNITMSSSGSTYNTANPRSGIGIDRDGNVFLVTVDGRQSGYSQGMTLPQFANYMKELGAVQALNFDGGGSTGMVKRDFSRNRLIMANSPSDGWERAVSTSLFIENTAPEGMPSKMGFSKRHYYATIGEEVMIEADYLLDDHFNVLDSINHELNIDGDESLRIDGQAVSGNTPGTYEIHVNAGNANEQLTLTVLEENISYHHQLIDGAASSVRAGASGSLNNHSVKGEMMTAVDKSYQLDNGESGTAAVYWNFNAPPEIKGQPVSIGLWVYGEGQGHWLRGTIQEPDGSQKVIDFTEQGQLNWHGWKYVKADVPKLAAGSKLTRMYVVETEETNKTEAKISYAGLTAHYNRFEPEYISNDESGVNVSSSKEWTVAFSVPVDPEDALRKIYVENPAGTRIGIDVESGKSDHELIIRPQAGVYSAGEYRLVIARTMVSKKGTILGEESDNVFMIQP